MITWQRRVPGSTRFVYIDIPDRSWEWQLYDMPGDGRCAKRLVSAIKKTCKEFDRLRRGEYPNIRSAMKIAFQDIMLEALDNDSEFGAADSEPRFKAEEIFCTYVRDVTGVDYYCIER